MSSQHTERCIRANHQFGGGFRCVCELPRIPTPPPWAASDHAVSVQAKAEECDEKLRALVLDLDTLAKDLDRQGEAGRFPDYTAFGAADSLRAVLRRHGVL